MSSYEPQVYLRGMELPGIAEGRGRGPVHTPSQAEAGRTCYGDPRRWSHCGSGNEMKGGCRTRGRCGRLCTMASGPSRSRGHDKVGQRARSHHTRRGSSLSPNGSTEGSGMVRILGARHSDGDESAGGRDERGVVPCIIV